MKFLLFLVDAAVVFGVIAGVALLCEVVDAHSAATISAAKRAEKQTDLSPDEYLALMREKAKEAGIKQRKHK